MHFQLVTVATLLFASMFIPLPSAAGLGMALWALATGVPLPAIIGMYVLQDIVAFAAMRHLLPRLVDRCSALGAGWIASLPPWAQRLFVRLAPRNAGHATVITATLLSFYAGAALAVLRHGATLRTGTLVIGTDVFKYVNGLLLALGIIQILPSSPWTFAAASMAGVAMAPVLRTTSRLLRPAPATVPVRDR